MSNILEALFAAQITGLNRRPADPDYPSEGLAVDLEDRSTLELSTVGDSVRGVVYDARGNAGNEFTTNDMEWAQAFVGILVENHHAQSQ